MYIYYHRWGFYPAHGDCPNQRDFLASARDYYHAKTNLEVTYWFDRKETLINWCYKWGRDYQVLHMSHDQFRRWLLNVDRERTKASYWHKVRWDRWSRFKEPSKFVRKPYIKKKQRSENYLQKQEWRKNKGFAKDKQKKKGWHRSCPKYIKRYCNKKLRQMERRCIWREEYDKLHSVTPKNLFDPWMWD